MQKQKLPVTFFLAVIFVIAYIVVTIAGLHNAAGWLLVGFFISVAITFRSFELLKGYAYTMVIFSAVSAAMYYPQYFQTIGDFKMSKLIIPAMQVIMFGMGTTLSLKDFSRVLQMPKGVIIGIVGQYSIMPFVGWGLTKVFSFPPEIAAGIILIGSCPSGLASNVMSYLAKANVALSVTLTAVATILAPVMTPMYMQLLAGEYVEIEFMKMFMDIVKIIIVPVGAGLLFNYFLHGKFKWLDSLMPVLSMAGITLVIVVVTAAGRNDLLVVGPLLMVAVLIHNCSGYLLGYWSSKAFRMPEQDCRTVALEVGLQNGGLGSALALAMGKVATVGLAPAVFGPLMNITGSTLALWWRAHTKDTDQAQ
jgi:BASS family bile acid:Na+ symporter